MKPRLVTNLGSIGGAPDPTTAPEVHTGVRKLHADQGYSQGNQPGRYPPAAALLVRRQVVPVLNTTSA